MAYDFCRQLVGEGLNPFTNEEIELRKAEAIDGVGSLIGIPHDGSVPLKEKLKGVLKPNERRKLTKQVKKEDPESTYEPKGKPGRPKKFKMPQWKMYKISSRTKQERARSK